MSPNGHAPHLLQSCVASVTCVGGAAVRGARGDGARALRNPFLVVLFPERPGVAPFWLLGPNSQRCREKFYVLRKSILRLVNRGRGVQGRGEIGP